LTLRAPAFSSVLARIEIKLRRRFGKQREGEDQAEAEASTPSKQSMPESPPYVVSLSTVLTVSPKRKGAYPQQVGRRREKNAGSLD
jgi:hypothetical protein